MSDHKRSSSTSFTTITTVTLCVVLGLASTSVEAGGDCRGPIKGPICKLRDGDGEARVQAALALRKLGPRAAPAIGALVKALGDKEDMVQFHAMLALKRVGPAVIPALIKATRSPSEGKRAYALWTLTSFKEQAAPAIPAAIAALDDKSEKVRGRAEEVLWRVGKAAIEPLTRIVADAKRSRHARAAACAVIGKRPAFKTPAAIAALLKAAEAPEAEVKIQAFRALGRLKAPAALPLLLGVLNSRAAPLQEQMHAIAAVGDLGPEIAGSAVGPLIRLLRSTKNNGLQVTIVAALTRFGPKARPAEPVLKGLIGRFQMNFLAKALMAIIGAKATMRIGTRLLRTPRWRDGVDLLGEMRGAAKPAIPALLRLRKKARRMRPHPTKLNTSYIDVALDQIRGH
jgi:HEAT repeat protein